MRKTVPLIGLESSEIPWVRLLVLLLRHPDPVIPQLTCHALAHIEEMIASDPPDSVDQAG